MTETILDVAQLILTLGVGAVVFLRVGPSRRMRRRAEIATMAVNYARQMAAPTTTNHDKLRTALESAQRLDAADNGKRDYSDAELRIAIEAELGRQKAAGP